MIKGYDGNDWLWGEDGNDKLEGGWGLDMLVGGAGADTFIWKMTSETGATIADADRILDFDPTLDRIDLRQIDADSVPVGIRPSSSSAPQTSPRRASCAGRSRAARPWCG